MKKILIGGYKDQTVNYAQAFSSLGAELEFLPDPGSRPPRLCGFLRRLFDGLVLPGGGDIAPSLFHRENKGSRNIDKALDCLQLSLLEAFVRAGKPILGICKGMQLINVGFGGTILQDLKPGSQDIHAWTGRDRIHITKAARGNLSLPALRLPPYREQRPPPGRRDDRKRPSRGPVFPGFRRGGSVP